MDSDSSLHQDLLQYKKEHGKDHILLNFTFKVSHKEKVKVSSAWNRYCLKSIELTKQCVSVMIIIVWYLNYHDRDESFIDV